MLQYPSFDPVLIAIGPVKVHWYGVMYLLGFIVAWGIGYARAKKPWSPLAPKQIEDLIFYAALGVVLGGRLGYVFFYGFDQFIADPLWLFKIWEGGMAFHGGLLGVFVALLLYARKIKQPLGAVCDFVAPLAPLGLGLGRIANFINGELYGRVSDSQWAMIFPSDPQQLPRHPSQLYQFVLEGLVLFAIVFLFSRQQRPRWSVTGMFLLFYGVARFSVEFFRQPDAGIGFDLFGWMTRGQILSLPMIIGGAAMLFYAFNNKSRLMSATTAPGQRLTPEQKPENRSSRKKRKKRPSSRR